MDPWRRKVWRGTIGMEDDGTVYIVVTVAPSRTRRHPHREHIVFWVRNLGNVSKGKQLKIPRDINNLENAEECENQELILRRRRFCLSTSFGTLSRLLHLPEFDTTVDREASMPEKRANQHRTTTKRRQAIGDITSRVMSSTKKTKRRDSTCMQSVQRSIQLEADTAPQRDNEPQTTTTIDNAPTRTLRDREQELRAQLLARSRVPPRREGSNKRPQPESTDDTEAPTAPSVASGETNTTREEDDQLELYGEPADWTAEADEALALLQQVSESTYKKGRKCSDNETTPTKEESNSRETQEEATELMHHERRRRPRTQRRTTKRSTGSRQKYDNKSEIRYKRG